MRPIVVKDGSDPFTRLMLRYLELRYSMAAGDVVSLNLESTVGEHQWLTIKVLVDRSHVEEIAKELERTGTPILIVPGAR